MDSIEKQKQHILAEVLKLAPFDGWTEHSLRVAVENLGYEDNYANVIFPQGISELADYFSQICDAQMVEALQKDMPERIRGKIARAVTLRLEQNAEHKEAIVRLLSFYAQPAHAPQATRNLWKTADAIWHAIGDTSADFNYYTKRTLLMGVYSSTLLYWLNDDSEDFANARAFLARRIEDVMKIQKTRGQCSEFANNFFSNLPTKNWPSSRKTG